MSALLLGLYVALPALAWWRVRSLAWVIIAIAGSGAVFGAAVNFVIDRGIDVSRGQLQGLLLIMLLAVVTASWRSRFRGDERVRSQAFRVLLPILVLLVLFLVITMRWTEEFAFLRPVSFLIGHGVAEDNAKWLDFTAQWASGDGIDQPVPMGGPLQLYMTFVGTAMSVISQLALGGINEVAVAANAVVYGEFMLVIAMPLAFASMAEARFAGRAEFGGDTPSARIPTAALWLGMLTLSALALVVMEYGHLTLQFTFLAGGLWAATFIAGSNVPRARLLTSLAAAASMTVWLPLNVIAIIIVAAWIIVYAMRLTRNGARGLDWGGLAMLALVTVGVFQPVYSSMYYLVFASSGAALPAVVIGAGLPAGGGVPALADSILFAATGGTEQAGPILVITAVAAVIGAYLVISWQPVRNALEPYVRFAPLGAFAGIAVLIFLLDLWATGNGPNYGSMKFSFMTAGLALAVTLPVSLLAIDGARVGVMTAGRWIGFLGILLLLSVDTVLPRALAQARPALWSPPIPFSNPASYWWPAEVNGTGVQPISKNPVACVYLPEGSPVPTAIVPSGLSDAQRPYACTRQLSGLAGLDAQAQPIVDWLRREWLTNTPAWSPVYDALASLPAEVLDRPVIVLDDGSNVKGIETLRALLARYPKEAADG